MTTPSSSTAARCVNAGSRCSPISQSSFSRSHDREGLEDLDDFANALETARTPDAFPLGRDHDRTVVWREPYPRWSGRSNRADSLRLLGLLGLSTTQRFGSPHRSAC